MSKTKVRLMLDVTHGFVSAWVVDGPGYKMAFAPERPTNSRRYTVEVWVDDPLEPDAEAQGTVVADSGPVTGGGK